LTEKKISRDSVEFQKFLITQFGLENYVGLIRRAKKGQKGNVNIEIEVFVGEGFEKEVVEAINYFMNRKEGEVVLIPSRKWTLRIFHIYPEILATEIISKLQGFSNLFKEEGRDYIM